MENINWVFWLKISIRKDWFSFYWTTRGANFMNMQLGVLFIDIGLPWKKTFRRSVGDNYIQEANKINVLNPWGIAIK